MKRLTVGFVLAVLCVVCGVLSAFAADPVRLVHIDNASWETSAVWVAPSSAVVRTSDCSQFGVFTQTIPQGGVRQIDHLLGDLCSSANPGVAVLPVVSGSVHAWSEVVFRDARGISSIVEIPSLPVSLAPSSFYSFAAIKNGFGRSTFIAFIADGATIGRARLSIRDQDNHEIATELVDVDSFRFYELATSVKTGSIVMTNEPPVIGAPGLRWANLYAVAFVGFREGGSPRAEVPSWASAAP